MSFVITNDLMVIYGISIDKLHADAIEASEKRRPPVFTSMRHFITKLCGIELPDDMDAPFYVVTSSELMFGASVLLYPEIFDKMRKRVGDRFYILPSSVHELILLPESESRNPKDLLDMVRSINASEVAEEDRLTDNIYFYDANTKVFRMVEVDEAKEEIAVAVGE